MTLAGTRIWLIGASEGIGEHLARLLASRGARLVLSARNGQRLETLAQELGQGCRAMPLDVTDPSQIVSVWRTISADGGVDTVVYNAGAYEPMGVTTFQAEAAEHMLNVNYTGALRMLACVLPAFLERGGGRIVLVASVAAYSGLPNALGYGASKAALLHLAENLRAELGGSAITVQVVNPGFVKTRLTDKNAFPMPCMMQPDEAARAIANGMETQRFEIHFPKRFTMFLKILRLLPYGLYFRLMRCLR